MAEAPTNNSQSNSDPVFKSTEIYKTQSQKSDEVFDEKKTLSRREKFQNWVKSHKWQTILIILAILLFLILLIILLINLLSSQSPDTTDGGASSGSGSTEQIADPDIDILSIGKEDAETNDGDTSGENSNSYSSAVDEVIDYYGEHKNSAADYINSAAQEAIDAGNTTAAAQIIVAAAARYAADGDYNRAMAYLDNVDLDALSVEGRALIASEGMSIASIIGDEDKYEYWGEIHQTNTSGAQGFGD